MADIINLQEYIDKKNRHKAEISSEMSKIVDAMERIISQCKEGLLDIPEMVNHLEYAISAMPPGSIDLEEDRKDRPFYIEESERLVNASKFSYEVITKIAKLADTLDQKHLHSEANVLDKILYSR